MFKTRPTTYLALSFILLCTIYWLHKASNRDLGYTAPFVTDEDKQRISEADRGGSRHRFVDSHSAGQFDTPHAIHVDLWADDDEKPISSKIDPEPESNAPQWPARYDVPARASQPKNTLTTSSTSTSKTSVVKSTATFKAIPREIWQTSSRAGKEKFEYEVKTWINLNSGEHSFTYNWISDEDADDFVHATFASTRPSVVKFWDDLSADMSTSPNSPKIIVGSIPSSARVLRADLLRYLLLLSQGGVYSDIDTSALKPIDSWIPQHLRESEINAIIGIEYDDNTSSRFTRPLSFCQWTLAAKPDHPIFQRAVNRVISNLDLLARRQRINSLSELRLEQSEVAEATGSGMISDVILTVIQDQLPESKIDWASFHGQREPKVFGDILVLPINGFASGQKHSNSGKAGYGEKLTLHHFNRSRHLPLKSESTTQEKIKESQSR